MEIDVSVQNQENLRPRFGILSGTLMIAGTTIGAGMLGIPLITAQAGFVPALCITLLVWLFMLVTGLLFLQVALWMPEGSNILSMAGRFLGWKGKVFVGGMFAFLYYCLMVAYFAAGAPLLNGFVKNVFGIGLNSALSHGIFGLIFAVIVAFGAKLINRTNILLTAALFLSYMLLIGSGSEEVETQRLQVMRWPAVFGAIPVLFSAFGYHNVIPSLCAYLKRDRRALIFSIIVGTSIPLIIYIIWQWLIIGTISQEGIAASLAKGETATSALQAAVKNPRVFFIGQYFAFFAIVTSMLGVAFSLVDFLHDGLKFFKWGNKRIFLCFLTFFPAFLCAASDPMVFDKALGVAGGFGEAFLNGLLPVALVWIGKYKKDLLVTSQPLTHKVMLAFLFAVSICVVLLESYFLFK